MSIVLQGSTSGSCTLQEQAIAGTTVLTLPTTSGTILTTGSSGQSIPKAALPTGSVLQVVSTTSTTQVTISSGGFNDITGLILSITPTSATSKILVIANCCFSSGGNGDAYFVLVRDGNRIPASTYAGLLNNSTDSAINYSMINNGLSYLDSPATTSSVTYKLQGGIAGGTTLYVNRRGLDTGYTGQSTITLMEIAA